MNHPVSPRPRLRPFLCLALACISAFLSILPDTANAWTGARVNLAKYQTATASVSNGNYVADFAVDGIASNFHAYRTGNQTAPYWLEIAYPRQVTVASAQLYLGILDGAAPAQVPANFRFQYFDGAIWRDIPGSAVGANTATEVNVVFTQSVTATRFRYYGTDNSNRTIREIALLPPNLVGGVEQGFPLGTDVHLNLAHARPATASSVSLANIYGAGYAKNAFDGYLDNLSRWVAASSAVGEYIEVDLLASHRVGGAHVYSGFIDPADSARTTTQPLPNFTLQYLDAATSAWLPVPGAEITNNTEVARALEFSSPVTTTRIRLVTTSAFNGRVQELLLFPPRTGGTALGREVLNAPPPARTWDFYSDSIYRLRNLGADLRLGLINGQIVQITPSTANVPFIEWQLLLNHRDGSYRVRNPETGLCLALQDISLADNTRVTAETYSGLPHQDWFIESDPVTPTRIRLVNRYSGLVLQALNTSLNSGAVLVVRPADPTRNNQYWNANLQRHHPKKGIAATANLISTSSNPYTTDPTLTFLEDFYNRLNGSWSYGWGRQTSDAFPFIADNHAYNPMQWGNFNWLHTNNAGPLERIYRDLQSNPKPLHLMGFNEPDKTSQGNISVADAIMRWPRLEAQDAPLVSPVPASTFSAWNTDFVAQADALGYRRDYTAVHWYASPSSDGLISQLQQAYNNFGRPVWLTEFSTVNWSGTEQWTDADNFNFLAEFLWRAEALTWLKRYSIFAFIKGPTDNPNQGAPDTPTAPRSNTLDADGSLTPFGQLYAGWDGVAAIQSDRAYHLHSHGNYRRAQNSGAGATPLSVTPDSAALGQQWFLSPGVTANTFRILSTRDGRPLRSADGASVSLGATGETGPAVEWRFTAETNGHGRHYIQHPASTNKRLRLATNGAYSLVSATDTNDLSKWRLVRPAVSDRVGAPATPAGLSTQATATSVALSWSGVDSPSTSYTVSRSPDGVDSWIDVATGITATSWTDPNLAPQTAYFYRVVATNLYALSSPTPATVSATTLAAPDPYATWTTTTLGARPLADQAPAADPDADGLPNLLEYALALDPLAPSASPLASPPGTHLRLSFLRARADLTYEVLASSTLAPDSWSVIATNPGAVSLATPVTVTDDVPVSTNPRRFLRLRVSRP